MGVGGAWRCIGSVMRFTCLDEWVVEKQKGKAVEIERIAWSKVGIPDYLPLGEQLRGEKGTDDWVLKGGPFGGEANAAFFGWWWI